MFKWFTRCIRVRFQTVHTLDVLFSVVSVSFHFAFRFLRLLELEGSKLVRGEAAASGSRAPRVTVTISRLARNETNKQRQQRLGSFPCTSRRQSGENR